MPNAAIAPPRGAQATLKALRLLKLFTPERPELELAEVTRLSGLHKTTAHRLLHALYSEGLLTRNSDTGAYSIGPALMALGVQGLFSNDLRRRARPLLKRLAEETGETATIEVPVDDSMLILDEINGPRIRSAVPNIGTRWPIYATSTGKAFIAFEENGLGRLGNQLKPLTRRTLVDRTELVKQLGNIRRTGIAEGIDELENGFSGVATVVRGVRGEVLGALSICGPTRRFDVSRRAWMGGMLMSAAARLGPSH